MKNFLRRHASLYLHDNVPLLRPESVESVESVEDTSFVSTVTQGDVEDTSSMSTMIQQDAEDKQPTSQRRDTMTEMIGRKVSPEDSGQDNDDDSYDEQRAELQLYGTEEQMSTLQDLSELLYTRGRLQELGCTFTDLGELITHGNPPNLGESEALLRLGPIYDEQWASFFSPTDSRFINNDPNMWSDMRTLKRVLENEGVAFDAQYRRLSGGDGSSKMSRLCTAYDDIQKLWWAAQPLVHIPPSIDKHEEYELNDTNDDSGCFMDDETEHVSLGPKQSGDHIDVPHKLGRHSDVTQNIGWRFSEDIDPAAVARYRDSLSEDDWAEMEEDLEAAVAVPLPAVDEHAPSISPTQPEKSRRSAASATISAFLNPSRPRHGPSPLQVSCGCSHQPSSDNLAEGRNCTTHDMLHRNELTANPRGDDMNSLGMDERILAAMEEAPSMQKPFDEQTEKKKSWRGWWQGVVGRRTGVVPYHQAQIGAGWW
jgi:hypothetical protein